MLPRILAIVFLLLALPAAAQENDQSSNAHGAYLAKAGDCKGCHTLPGHQVFAGGYPLHTPFGKIYSTNITPDPADGIGTYSFANFNRALRQGIAKDGHHLYPAMPYISFAKISQEDMHNLYTYFMKGVAPIASQPPATKLPFPFNQRWGMAIWNKIFGDGNTAQSGNDPLRDRGAYLVESLGHCGACHTPRNIFYAEKGYSATSKTYLGGSLIDNWYAPTLRDGTADGLQSWSEEDIVSFLKTGSGHGTLSFGGMNEVIENSTQFLSAEDLKAIARYLKTFSAQSSPKGIPLPPAPKNEFEQPGAGLYQSSCARCHGKKGEGRDRYPGLAGIAVVMSVEPASLVRLVLEGGKSAATQENPKPRSMPSFSRFTDQEIGEVLTYVRRNWGNAAPSVTTREVRAMRQILQKTKSQR